jgi:hypothetical protein
VNEPKISKNLWQYQNVPELQAYSLGEVERNKKKFNCIWQPDALPGEIMRQGMQYEFLSSTERYVGLDGGKGSSKTDLLIWDCIRPEKLNNPQWIGVIFRREYKRLTEVIGRATFWLNQMPELKASWNGEKSRFIFPSGSWLGFHNVQNLGDEVQYQGWQITDLKFDQLDEFEEEQFNYLCLQNRSGSALLHPTVRWTANPLGVAHVWIKKRFIDDREPSKWVVGKNGKYEDGRLVRGKTYIINQMVEDGITYTIDYKRIFGTIDDNPYFRKHPENKLTLLSDPNPYRRRAFAFGDWNVTIGQFFDTFASEVHVIKNKKLDKTFRRMGGLDYGNDKVLTILAKDYEDNCYVEYEYESHPSETNPNGITASQFAESSGEWMLKNEIYGLNVIADTNMWIALGREVGTKHTPALIIQGIWNEMFKKIGKRPPRLLKVTKRATEEYRYRVACNESIRDALRYEVINEVIVRNPKIYFLERCKGLIEMLPALQADPADPMDIINPDKPHNYDAFKYAYMRISKTPKEIPIEELPRIEQVFREIEKRSTIKGVLQI